jgi:hypothetical protein
MSKDYLGDSVYAEVDDCGNLVLTTENGLGASNTIVLEPEVIAALERYVKRNLKSEEPVPGSLGSH